MEIEETSLTNRTSFICLLYIIKFKSLLHFFYSSTCIKYSTFFNARETKRWYHLQVRELGSEF